jgi:hypothetical protein
MTPVTFTIDGVEGDFTCDADEVKSYKTVKQFAMGDDNPAGVFEAMERIFPGHDEEYMERIGGDIESMNTLCNAAMEAVKAKNSSASSRASKSTEAK